MSYTVDYLEEVRKVVDRLDIKPIEKMISLLVELRRDEGRLFFLGVGGGAGNATHAVNDFRKIAGIESYTPTDNISELSARVNDNGWNTVFVDWLKGSRLNRKDGVFVFSVGGGNAEKNISANIVEALKYAKETGAKVIGVVGRDGVYYTMVYGNPCSAIPDPIEKKPFFHFLPGTWAFSIATAGCNLNCKFCQNWEISQSRPEETRNYRLPPADVVAGAKESNCKSIAYTYTEPAVFYEYMLDTAKLGRKAGIKSVVISAGFISPEPLRQLCEHVDAVKIDLKSLRNKFYNETCNGELQPVLDALKVLRDSGVWYEIVYLVVTSLNDSDEELRDTARWVYENLGPDVPLHFSRFYPMYQLRNLPPTAPQKLTTAREMAMDVGLNYVYIGNVSGDKGESTYCPKCGKMLIKRVRYFIRQNNIVDGKCKWCDEKIPGVWDDDHV